MVEDKLGKQLQVGQTVLKVRENGVTAVIDFRQVVRISENKVYLNSNSNNKREIPIRYPNRLIIWPQVN